MAGTLNAKRPARPLSTSSKKRKLNNGKKTTSRVKVLKQAKAADRGTIPIPNVNDGDDDEQLSDQDIALFAENAANFLHNLDHNGLMQSKKETQRLHKLTKPVYKPKVYDDGDLPSLHSGDDEEDSDWSSSVDLNSDALGGDIFSSDPVANLSDVSNFEMPYEILPRKHHSKREIFERKMKALPIKLADGKIKDTGLKIVKNVSTDEERTCSSDGSEVIDEVEPVEDISTGARFGRLAVVDILQTKSRKQKIELAKEQIAGICQDILTDPENSLGLLRRIHTFTLPTVATTTHCNPVPNDPVIRQLAILSQMAVFKDIIPGYRIRALTESEKAEKVSQIVARTRDWEQGLVNAYQTYMRLLEGELKAKTELADIALHCMCKLLVEATHFNFRTNLMTCIVSYLSKKSWDKASEMCSQSLITVFRQDLSGVPSLEIVRLLNRMIKERHFKIHPNVLSCLLHLRLRTELGIRASDRSADKPEIKDGKHPKGRKPQKVHLSKKAKKALNEQKEINKELREAEAEVDKEEKQSTQTETLKLLFSLYFRILKSPTSTPLLPSALSGISKFTHLINIDFFSDLMKILKDIISREGLAIASSKHLEHISAENACESILQKLMCIATAFELLSGQGEALNIDLSEFVLSLYSLLMPLTLPDDICVLSSTLLSGKSNTVGDTTIIDLLFRALSLIFLPRAIGSINTGYTAGTTSGVPWRAAAFAKRLLSASLHWTSSTDVLRAVDFVKTLVAKDPKLEAMLSTEDRIVNGVYRPDVDDPQLCQPFDTVFWELHVLHKRHWDPRVREQAERLINFRPQ